MKKVLALVLAVMLLVSVFTACGSDNGTVTETTNLVIPSASCVSNLNPLLESMKEGVILPTDFRSKTPEKSMQTNASDNTSSLP